LARALRGGEWERPDADADAGAGAASSAAEADETLDTVDAGVPLLTLALAWDGPSFTGET
jgi:hypothetical protein